MKLALAAWTAVFIILSAPSAQSAPQAAPALKGLAPLYQLSCEYRYKTPHRDAKSKSNVVRAFAYEARDKEVRFYARKTNVPAFFFELNNGAPSPVWHKESELIINARLEGNWLVYQASFKNFRRERNETAVLWNERREVYLDQLQSRGYREFSFKQGRLLERKSDEAPWVNEKGVEITRCAIERFDGLHSPSRRQRETLQ